MISGWWQPSNNSNNQQQPFLLWPLPDVKDTLDQLEAAHWPIRDTAKLISANQRRVWLTDHSEGEACAEEPPIAWQQQGQGFPAICVITTEQSYVQTEKMVAFEYYVWFLIK